MGVWLSELNGELVGGLVCEWLQTVRINQNMRMQKNSLLMCKV